MNLSYVTQIVIMTHMGQTRVRGRADGKYKVNYEYSAFQPFVGIFSYQLDEVTVAIGAYEDDCHNAPKRLPFGFEDFNIPSMEEVSGEKSVSSMTWVNLDHGESTHEAELLDKIKVLEEE